MDIKSRTNKRIASLLVRAQNASDGGKGIADLIHSQKGATDNESGYSLKDRAIYTALSIIAKGKSDFHYAVTDGGITPYLVYIQTKIDGKKYQVSFHSYDARLERFLPRSFRIKWDRGDSREAASAIYRHFMPNGRYC